MTHQPIVIGRSEFLNFIGIAARIPAKIDTGAYHSAIHYVHAQEIEREGLKLLYAELLGHPSARTVCPMEFSDYKLVAVRNSFGTTEIRYKVRLKVKIGSKLCYASFTLANRANNLMPVLIGRELLGNRFLVDVSRTGVDRRQLRTLYRQPLVTPQESKV